MTLEDFFLICQTALPAKPKVFYGISYIIDKIIFVLSAHGKMPINESIYFRTRGFIVLKISKNDGEIEFQHMIIRCQP